MGIFSKFRKGFSRGAQAVRGAFDVLSGRGQLNEDDLLDLEEALYESDFGVETTEEILDGIRESRRKDKELRGCDALALARATLERILDGAECALALGESNADKPEVVCLVGVNGSGKTTTCAKLGHLWKEAGHSVLIGACDTFRAAATEQLKSWTTRLDLEIVAGHHGADAAAVAFDAYAAADSRNRDLLLLDTAGRLHVKDNLMEELYKLRRVLQKKNPEAPHHSWLVIDGSTGTNAIEQARVFNEKFGLNGLVVTKLDGTSKGGALVGIYRDLKLPIRFVGLGEAPDDLQPFSVEHYVNSILPIEGETDAE